VHVRWAAALVIVLLVSACGGSSRLSPSAYRAHLATVARESDVAQADIEKGFRAASVPQLVKVLKTFESAETRVGDEVAALEPPKNAVAANAELAKGLHDTAAEVKTFLPRIEKLPTATAAVAFLQKTGQTKGGRELDDALASLKRLGYIKKIG
jgi:hypothetical protein